MSVESTQWIHSHLSTDKRDDVEFAMDMIAKCTKVKVLQLTPPFAGFGRLAFSSQSFLNVLSKSTSLQTLSLGEVQLSDMVNPP